MTEKRRVNWLTYRFTGFSGGPAYVDLLHVAAITEAKDPDGALIDGARIILYSGTAVFVRESADAVFSEVHRARTETEPLPDKIRLPDAVGPSSAPAPAVPITLEKGVA